MCWSNLALGFTKEFIPAARYTLCHWASALTSESNALSNGIVVPVLSYENSGPKASAWHSGNSALRPQKKTKHFLKDISKLTRKIPTFRHGFQYYWERERNRSRDAIIRPWVCVELHYPSFCLLNNHNTLREWVPPLRWRLFNCALKTKV